MKVLANNGSKESYMSSPNSEYDDDTTPMLSAPPFFQNDNAAGSGNNALSQYGYIVLYLTAAIIILAVYL